MMSRKQRAMNKADEMAWCYGRQLNFKVITDSTDLGFQDKVQSFFNSVNVIHYKFAVTYCGTDNICHCAYVWYKEG